MAQRKKDRDFVLGASSRTIPPRSRPEYPTVAEFRRMVETASGKWPALLRVLGIGGRLIRVAGEVTWDDMDLDRGVLRYVPKGSPADKAFVPLPPGLVLALRQWKMSQPTYPDNLVFPNSRGTMISEGDFRDEFARLQIAAGITTSQGTARYQLRSLRWFFKDLRATFCGPPLSPKALQMHTVAGLWEDQVRRFAAAEHAVFPPA